MTILIANTANTNQVLFWRARTNELADAMSTKAVTTNSNTTVGNASITGTLSSTILTANTLRGGTETVSANLTVTSNISFNSQLVNLGIGANVSITTGNVTHKVLKVSVANNSTIYADKVAFSDVAGMEGIVTPANNDFLVWSTANSSFYPIPANNVGALHTHTFAQITATPTTITGYGVPNITYSIGANTTYIDSNFIKSSNTTGVQSYLSPGRFAVDGAADGGYFYANTLSAAVGNTLGSTYITAQQVYVSNTVGWVSSITPGNASISSNTGYVNSLQPNVISMYNSNTALGNTTYAYSGIRSSVNTTYYADINYSGIYVTQGTATSYLSSTQHIVKANTTNYSVQDYSQFYVYSVNTDDLVQLTQNSLYLRRGTTSPGQITITPPVTGSTNNQQNVLGGDGSWFRYLNPTWNNGGTPGVITKIHGGRVAVTMDGVIRTIDIALPFSYTMWVISVGWEGPVFNGEPTLTFQMITNTSLRLWYYTAGASQAGQINYTVMGS